MPDPTEFPESEQDRAKALIRSADATAPPALRARLEEMIATAEREQQTRRPESRWRRNRSGERRRVGFAMPGLAAVAAAAIVAIVIALGGSTPTPPSLQAAAAVALAPSTSPAPAAAGDRLDVSSAGVPFPDWYRTVGWRAVGTRTDTVHGRRVVTVFYAGPRGERVGYSIVGGEPLTVPTAPVVQHQGIAFTVLRRDDANVITWQRYGHTCVLASRTAAPTRLIGLATSPA
jgi:hypothetical protein